MLQIDGLHHIAIICSNIQISKLFYCNVLGFKIVNETYRAERDSYKVDLSLHDTYLIELFSFPIAPARLTQPEATGLRHLSFKVNDLHKAIKKLLAENIIAEPVRIDEITGKQFTFIFDPDQLPIELYES